jgi:hypothetical protein
MRGTLKILKLLLYEGLTTTTTRTLGLGRDKMREDKISQVRFQVLMAVSMKMTVF